MEADGVFTSVRQALHVSFLMEIMPATGRSQLQGILERLMEEAGIVRELEKHERTIDFRGLSSLEVRAQCAMVVGSVNAHLVPPEQAAIWTRFGLRRRQAQGVRALMDYVSPTLSTQHDTACLAMAWGLFAREGRRDDFSLNKIAAEFNLARTTLQRDQQKIGAYQRTLEERAVRNLTPYFERTGLVSVAVKQEDSLQKG
jgi:hypothetical protein